MICSGYPPALAISKVTALLSAPICTSVTADKEVYINGAADSSSLAGLGVIVVADDDVITSKLSCSHASGSAKSWAWSYFKKADASGKSIAFV